MIPHIPGTQNDVDSIERLDKLEKKFMPANDLLLLTYIDNHTGLVFTPAWWSLIKV